MSPHFATSLLALAVILCTSGSINAGWHYPIKTLKISNQNKTKIQSNPILKTMNSKLINPVIVNGGQAGQNEANFIVQLRQKVSESKFKFCGGSLLSQTVVLTAAHCVSNGFNLQEAYVRYGTKSLQNSEFDDIPLQGAYPHPNFNHQTGKNDIAIVVLARPVQQSNMISFIRFGKVGDGQHVMIYGWGNTQGGGHLSNVLEKISLTTLPWQKCSDQKSIICAQNSHGSACQGDSGGPMVNEQGILVGVTSRVENGCFPNGMNWYTRVSSYRKFIKSFL